MTQLRRILLSAVAALALAGALAPSASAATQTIPGSGVGPLGHNLTIYVGDNGQLQAKQGAPADSVQGMIFGNDFGPASQYWHLRLKSDPAVNLNGGPAAGNFVTVSNGPVTGNGTPSSPFQNETVMKVQHSGVDLFEVKQTVLYTAFEASFRVAWDVRNIDPQNRTLSFIFGTSADTYIGGADSGVGVFIDGASRFVGVTNPTARVTGGVQEVTSSRLPGEASATPVANWASYEEGYYSPITNRLNGADAFLNTIDPNFVDAGLGVSWSDQANSLSPNETVRYETRWHAIRPTPLSAFPSNAAKELPGSHDVTFRLVDANFNPVANQLIRWNRTGVNGDSGTARTNDQGQVVVSWNGTSDGVDNLTGYADINEDGTQDADEPSASATMRWLADNHVDGPPDVPNELNGPNGNVPVQVQENPDNPEAPTYMFGRGATSSAGFTDCLFDQRSGRNLNLPISVDLEPGGGTISNAQIFVVDRARHNPADLNGAMPPASDSTAEVNGNTYSFVIPCVVNGDMWIEFTLTENGNSQTFRIPIGGLLLIDPQGVVHDRVAYDAARARGLSEDAARAESAIRGATVRLQRAGASGAFSNVLSGDPGISPNVNPQITGPNGLFQWDVSAGTYRVLVNADGYQSVTSRSVDIPPPVLDLHIAMERVGSAAGPGGPGGGADADQIVLRLKGGAILRLSRTKSKVGKDGKVRLGTVECPASASDCDPTRITLYRAQSPRKRIPRPRVLGKGAFDPAPGRTAPVDVKLSKRARNAVEDLKSFKAKVGIDQPGTSRPRSATVTLGG